MLKLLLMLVISVIIASLLVNILRKGLKLILFVGLVIVVFLLLSSLIYPENSYIQKGKEFILGTSKNVIERGKEKITSYVVIENASVEDFGKDLGKKLIKD